MNSQLIQWVTKSEPAAFPELFDDPSSKNKLNVMMKIAYSRINTIIGNGDISDDNLKQLLLFLTAHLIYATQDNDISSVQVADVHFQLNNSSRGSSGSSGNNSDPYLGMFMRLLSSLGLYQDWNVQLG